MSTTSTVISTPFLQVNILFSQTSSINASNWSTLSQARLYLSWRKHAVTGLRILRRYANFLSLGLLTDIKTTARCGRPWYKSRQLSYIELVFSCMSYDWFVSNQLNHRVPFSPACLYSSQPKYRSLRTVRFLQTFGLSNVLRWIHRVSRFKSLSLYWHCVRKIWLIHGILTYHSMIIRSYGLVGVKVSRFLHVSRSSTTSNHITIVVTKCNGSFFYFVFWIVMRLPKMEVRFTCQLTDNQGFDKLGQSLRSKTRSQTLKQCQNSPFGTLGMTVVLCYFRHVMWRNVSPSTFYPIYINKFGELSYNTPH